jgi:signal transduction histidine kinase
MNLKNKIILIILEFSLIPLTFLGFVIYSNNKVQIIQTTVEKLDAIAQIQKNRLQDVLDAKQNLLRLFVTKPLLRSYLSAFDTQPTPLLQKNMNDNLLEATAGLNGIVSIIVADPKGEVVASTDVSFIGRDISTEDFFQHGIVQEDVSILKKDSAGNIRQYLVGPLSLNGKTIGMVTLIASADDFINLANDYTGLGNTGETLLVKNDGFDDSFFISPIRFDKNAGLNRIVLKEKINVPSLRAIKGIEGVYLDGVDYRNIPVFASTRYINQTGWGIVVKIDKDEVLTPVRKLLELFLAIYLGTAVIIIYLSIPLAKYITTNEERLDQAREELVSLASHQLRGPITAISWNLELLLSGKVGPLINKQKKSLEDINVSVKKMLDLVGGYLDITKIESRNYEIERGEVNLTQIADSILKVYKGQIQDKKITIVKKFGKAIPISDIGTKTAGIIFQNFITNSLKYTSKGGTIVVAIKHIGNDVIISVKDNGLGIPENAKADIFTKLYRADNAKQIDPSGTGLGLYLVKSLVDKLGGKVWFESKEGSGTTFYISLKA